MRVNEQEFLIVNEHGTIGQSVGGIDTSHSAGSDVIRQSPGPIPLDQRVNTQATIMKELKRMSSLVETCRIRKTSTVSQKSYQRPVGPGHSHGLQDRLPRVAHVIVTPQIR